MTSYSKISSINQEVLTGSSKLSSTKGPAFDKHSFMIENMEDNRAFKNYLNDNKDKDKNQALKDFNKTLSNEINRNIKLANILKNSRRERKMIIFLMSIFNQNANHIGSDQGFDLNMSRGDISSYLSISREEISRILQNLEISGLIFVKNRHIALLNIPKLNAMCFDDYFLS